MSQVILKKIVKQYGETTIIHGINLVVEDKEFVVLVGPSGCGKSTTLRMIAGLEDISSGSIKIGDRVVNNISPKDRNVAMVFQNYALYPHMTVFDNMAFSLKMHKLDKTKIRKKVIKSAKVLGLDELLDRKPASLSGGQRQRVAMGRAIVRNPEVFLFDEPLSNLDAQLRTQMRRELKKLHWQLKTTTIYVTHDQVEAMSLADRIVILKDGYIQQVATPIDIYEQPANMFVARFIGNPPMNIFTGIVKKKDKSTELQSGNLRIPLTGTNWDILTDNMPVMIGIRPEAIKRFMNGNSKSEFFFDGKVIVSEVMGGQSLLEIDIGENSLIAEIEGRILPSPGEIIRFGIDIKKLHLFDPETEKIIN